jgi:hypothetical protein
MPDRLSSSEVEQQLGEELLRLHRESYVKGAGNARDRRADTGVAVTADSDGHKSA